MLVKKLGVDTVQSTDRAMFGMLKSMQSERFMVQLVANTVEGDVINMASQSAHLSDQINPKPNSSIPEAETEAEAVSAEAVSAVQEGVPSSEAVTIPI